MSNPEPAAGTIGATTPAGVEKPPQKKISLFEVDDFWKLRKLMKPQRKGAPKLQEHMSHLKKNTNSSEEMPTREFASHLTAKDSKKTRSTRSQQRPPN